MSIDAVNTRWDGFLTQIRGRFDQIMQESMAGCAAVFEQTGETLALGNAWTGMRIRGMALSTKVQDTWDEKVSTAFDDADASSAQEDAARARGEALQDYMEVESFRVETQIYCDIARKLQAKALAEQGEIKCSQCGATLEHDFSIRAINKTCPHCSALNTIEPGTSARMVEGLSHHLCNEAAWTQWLAMHNAEERYRNARTASLQDIQAFEDAQIAYWQHYLQHRIQIDSDRAKDLDADLRGKLHQFYVSIKHERAWIDAERPRKVAAPVGA